MFSQACVKNSVHREEGVSQAALGQTPPAQCMLGYTPLGQTPPGQTPPGHTPPWEDTLPWADTPLPGRHPPTATAAIGTHPTGMHSCVINMLIKQIFCI